MGKLGYTLSGFYLVNGSDSAERFRVVFCQFTILSQGTYTSKDRVHTNIHMKGYWDWLFIIKAAKQETFGFFNLLEMNTKSATTAIAIPMNEYLEDSDEGNINSFKK